MHILEKTTQLLEKLKEKNNDYTIKNMLNDLRKINPHVYDQKWYDAQVQFYTKSDGSVHKKVQNQKIYKPNVYKNKIPTLQKNIYKPMSDMLRARFDFAGRWVGAYCMSWLGIEDMKSVWQSSKIQKKLHTFRSCWEGNVLSLHSNASISLFGYDANDMGMTFLMWKEDKDEPLVYTYIGHEEKKYKNLNAFLVEIL